MNKQIIIDALEYAIDQATTSAIPVLAEYNGEDLLDDVLYKQQITRLTETLEAIKHEQQLSSKTFADALPVQYSTDIHLKLCRDAELAEQLVDSLTVMDESAATDKIIIQADGQQISIGLWHIEVIDFLRIFVKDVKQLAVDELSTMIANMNRD